MSDSPDSASEKQRAEHRELAPAGLEGESQELDPAYERRLAISLIDRTNISVARTVGMAVDLELTVGERYSIITCIFFVPYILFEIPSNLVIRRIGPRNLLASIAVAWGAVMLGMGFVKDWGQLAVCRVLLGICEAGFFPGCTFLITTWYRRYETAKRMAFFYLSALVAAGFSNILGWAFSLLDGAHGIEGWRWVFIIFAAMTIGLALISWFLIVDFPDRAKFLSEDERRAAVDRIQRERGDALPDQLTAAKIFKHMIDPKIWGFGICFGFSTMPTYAFGFFLPVILSGGGYDTKTSLLLSAPPYAAAGLYTAGIAYLSDKYRQLKRANNVLSHSKRAVSSAICIGMGGVGGIFASLVYRQADYPRYIPGLMSTVGCQIVIVIICCINTLYFRSQNRKADRGEVVIEGNPSFRYAI
ncbi:hypothetical protein Rhopal_005900-T1 [Rhodotorula paludigena]|uniref:Major facilitator superfamily (MFS) profile domain-containing protein n=1 Tax=Rhodotorula paludigena TaxID=86838 RepID=A0AAV5GSH3_9BASI|nr:hypothetical protein Rhopal_005900-T1 [Rhodotorula paludigena]